MLKAGWVIEIFGCHSFENEQQFVLADDANTSS